MTKHVLYAGGNKRNQPWEPNIVSGNTHPTVRYAAHLKTRHKVVEYALDMSSEDIQNYFRHQSLTKFTAGDEIATHLLGAGTFIKSVVLQVKAGVAPATADLVLSGLVGAAPLPLVGLVSPDEATDASAESTGNAGTETDVAPVYAVPALNLHGWFHFPVDMMLQDEGDLSIKFGTDIAAGCFSIFVELIDFASEHECECPAIPCDTQFGPPLKC